MLMGDVLDGRTFRGVIVDSDRFLVMAKIRSWISTPKLRRDRIGDELNQYHERWVEAADISKKFSEVIAKY